MIDKKKYDEITKNLNNLVNRLGYNTKSKFEDSRLIYEISKYLQNNYINKADICEFRVNCKYPIIDIFIRFNNFEIEKIPIIKFVRIEKLLKLKELSNANI